MHRHYLLPIFLLAGALASGCRTGGTSIPVSRDSEAGQLLARLDDAEKQYNRNVRTYESALEAYETAQGRKPGRMAFWRISDAVETLGPHTQIRILKGGSDKFGWFEYRVRITYEDNAFRVVKQVEVLERI